jgi:NADP-dependent 3-hydroxy acid dehydrogenase YdfG
MTESTTDFPYRTALIVGAGAGISASVARRLSALGVKVGLAARNIDKLQPLLSQAKAIAFAADARDPGAVAALFDDANRQLGGIDAVIYNAGARVQ